MPPETQPEQPKEAKPVPALRRPSEGGRSSSDVLGVAYDYYKEAWDNLWRKKRTEIKKEVEVQRGIIEKEGLKFKEMKFDEAGKVKPEQQLQNYVENLSPAPATDKEKIKTASDMVAELPESKYSKREKELIGKYVAATTAIESGGKYEVLGIQITKEKNPHFGDRALGKYQPMPKNWMKWCSDLFGGKIVEPDRQAQEYVAFKRFMINYDVLKKEYPNDEYKRFYALASRWIGGGFATEFMGEKIPLGGDETKEYCENAMRRMGLKQPYADQAKTKAADYVDQGGKAYKKGKKTYEKAKQWWKGLDKTVDRRQ